MANFHSLPLNKFPLIGVSGDVYYANDTQQIFLCAGVSGMVPFDGILSGGISLATGPAGPQGPTGPTGPAAPSRFAAIQCVIDGAGSPPAPGIWASFPVPFNCTVLGWTLLADIAGDAVLDVKKGSFAAFPTSASITGAAQPSLESSQKSEDVDVSAEWETALSVGNIIQVALLSVATCTRITLAINISIP